GNGSSGLPPSGCTASHSCSAKRRMGPWGPRAPWVPARPPWVPESRVYRSRAHVLVGPAVSLLVVLPVLVVLLAGLRLPFATRCCSGAAGVRPAGAGSAAVVLVLLSKRPGLLPKRSDVS